METLPKKFNKNLTEEFYHFINSHSPKEVSLQLKLILIDYLSAQVRMGFPLDVNEYLWELSDLFDLLDSATDYLEEQKTALRILRISEIQNLFQYLKLTTSLNSTCKAEAIAASVEIVGLISPLSILPTCDNGMSASFDKSS